MWSLLHTAAASSDVSSALPFPWNLLPGAGAAAPVLGVCLWVIIRQNKVIDRQADEIRKSNAQTFEVMERALPLLSETAKLLEDESWERRHHPGGT